MTTAQPGYVWQKTYQAVLILATSTKSLRERLGAAWWNQLNSLTGHPIPWDDLREKFEKIQRDLLPEISRDSAPRLSEEKLREIAGEIVDLYDDACKRNVPLNSAVNTQ
jgi:hypothetical protein